MPEDQIDIQRLRSLDLDLGDFQKLTHLTIHVDGTQFKNEQSWKEVSNFLGRKRSMPPNLTFLEILLVGISYFDIGLATNTKNAGWGLAQQYLAPKYLPALKEFGIRGYWMYEKPADVDDQGDDTGDDAVSKAFTTSFRHCYPSWKKDARKLKLWCKFLPDYERRGISDSGCQSDLRLTTPIYFEQDAF